MGRYKEQNNVFDYTNQHPEYRSFHEGERVILSLRNVVKANFKKKLCFSFEAQILDGFKDAVIFIESIITACVMFRIMIFFAIIVSCIVCVFQLSSRARLYLDLIYPVYGYVVVAMLLCILNYAEFFITWGQKKVMLSKYKYLEQVKDEECFEDPKTKQALHDYYNDGKGIYKIGGSFDMWLIINIIYNICLIAFIGHILLKIMRNETALLEVAHDVGAQTQQQQGMSVH